MKLGEYSNIARKAIAIAGIIGAVTGCSKPAKKEVSQRDEHASIVRNTRKSIGSKESEGIPKPITLPRFLVERANVERKIVLPSQVDDIGPLTGIPIEEFEVEHTYYRNQLEDLNPLIGAPLKKIDASRSLVKDIEALRDMPLEEVNIGDTAVSDLTPLKGKNIRVLKIHGSPIKSLEAIRGMPLEIFHLGSHNPLYRPETSDLSPLKNCPLKEVMFRGIEGSDFSVLKGMPIEVLDLSYTEIRDLSILEGMPLRNLNISWTGVRDIEVLRGMQLKSLSLTMTTITDLSPLAGMPLEYLEIGGVVTDLRPIKDILDRLRNVESGRGGGFSLMEGRREVDWDTYQIVDIKRD